MTTNNYYSTQWNLTAQYGQPQSEISLRDTVKLLQMGLG